MSRNLQKRASLRAIRPTASPPNFFLWKKFEVTGLASHTVGSKDMTLKFKRCYRTFEF
ncbi:MAG TPA: hypothetical protein PLL86_05230 [Leptospiraceae bacterium]|nr:hypothetical protein [Leptospiraceae bacterium]